MQVIGEDRQCGGRKALMVSLNPAFDGILLTIFFFAAILRPNEFRFQ